MVFFFMDWKAVDERLIRRGELLLSLDFMDGYDELEDMNRKKAGILIGLRTVMLSSRRCPLPFLFSLQAT